MRSVPAPAAFLAVLTLCVGAAAAETVYITQLDGATAGTASNGLGTATLILNDEKTAVAYDVDFQDLSGVETGAHFHYAEPGSPGPRLLTLNLGLPKIGVWELDAFDLAQLEAGLVFVMIHSDVYPGGELRGNLTSGVVASEAASWGGVKALFR
ncbi:CHRD domain-containing protein [bacterium]|nr:CHRD domain-containing protein [bacterium]